MNKIESSFLHMARLAGALASGAEEWHSLPYILEFAPNNLCNLRCLMCAHNAGVPPRKMKKEDTVRVLDELLPRAGLLVPSALSEPLLSGIELIVEKCTEYDTWLNIITNGTLLTPEKFEFVAPRIFYLKFSFETHVEATFEKLRVNADYATTLENLKYATRRSTELNIPFTVVTILMQPLLDELLDFVDFLAGIGVQRLDVLHFLENAPDGDPLRVMGTVPEEKLMALREKLIAKTESLNMDIRFDMPAPLGGFFIRTQRPFRGIMPEIVDTFHNTLKKEYPNFCHHMACYLRVDPEGNAYPCCRATEDLRLGNILHQSFEEVWNGEPARVLRRSLFSGKLLPCCQACTARPGSGTPL
jgi:radical SAM protein with 4Fe4S-binding SPASM domain